MPNHLHSIIVLTDSPVGALLAAPPGGRMRTLPDNTAPAKKGAVSRGAGHPPLGNVVRTFKSLSAIRVNRLLARTGQPLWQRNYYEHVIRNESTLDAIREYIEKNPSQWHNDLDNPDVIRLTPSTR